MGLLQGGLGSGILGLHMSFLPNLVDMGSLLGTILGTILSHKMALMSTVKGPLVRLILTVTHMT